MSVDRIEELERAAEVYPLLTGLSAEHLRKLLEIAEQREFPENEILFGEGAKSEYLYLIASGRIALEFAAAHRIVVQTLGPGDAMGWSALTRTAKTHFQARTLSRVRAIVFDGTKLSIAFEYDHSLGYEMMKRLLALVTDRLDHTRMQVIDMYGKAGTAQR